MDETDFKMGDLKVQLSQSSIIVNLKDLSNRKIVEISSEFGKNHGQKLLIQRCLNEKICF